MATDKQIVANRQNAKYSTGPRTEYGKRRSRRNAVRHGLSAETLIDVHEDPIAYRTLERAINADYRPRTNFELELVARLVSLLWRLRRAVAIESGLLDIHGDSAHDHKVSNGQAFDEDRLSIFYNLIPSLGSQDTSAFEQQKRKHLGTERMQHFARTKVARSHLSSSFLSLDSTIFDRLGRYEASLWRQIIQTILLLNAINRRDNEGCFDCAHLTVRRKRRSILWPPFVGAD
jgi:hypothetical protein